MMINDDGEEIDRNPVNPSVKVRGMFFEKLGVATGKRKSMEMKTDSLSEEELTGKVKSICKVDEKPKDTDSEPDIQSEKEEEIETRGRSGLSDND